MKYNRWYDKYPELQSLLSLLENIDENYLSIIAEDFIQIIISRYGDNFDEAIKAVADNAPPSYSRWYDEDYNLHTSIEFIKLVDENQKKDLINAFIVSVLGFMSENGYEK